jgi:hypothetical protein
MKAEFFEPSVEGKARALVLIRTFSEPASDQFLDGWAKLFRIDFLVRYPGVLKSILENRSRVAMFAIRKLEESQMDTIEERMLMHKWGPWDPSHYAHVGWLYSTGLITSARKGNMTRFQVSETGVDVAERLRENEDWGHVFARAELVRAHVNLSARGITELIEENMPRFDRSRVGEYI